MVRKMLSMIFIAGLLTGVLSKPAFPEAKYTIKEMTPAVESALENRRNRYDKLSEFKKNGVIGENNNGYVELLTSHEEARAIVEAENRDRTIIYQTIAEQNGLQDALGTIEKVFAEVQREKAQPGEKIQSEDGSWRTK